MGESDGLDVVFLPGSYADLGHLLLAEVDRSRELIATADDRTLGAVLVVQPQAVNTDADARADLCQDLGLEIS